MIICLTTSEEGMAITQELQRKGLAEYVVHHVLYVAYPFVTYNGEYDGLVSDGIDIESLPRPPIIYSFKSYNDLYQSPNLQTSHPQAAEQIYRIEDSFYNPAYCGECMVEFCTTIDLWGTEAHDHNLSRQFLDTFLSFPDCNIQILTKNAALVKDFDIIEKHKDRVYVGMYIPATPDKSDIISIIEPQASRIEERMEVLRKANSQGFYTCCSFYPLLHGIADSPEQIDELIRFADEIRALELIVEPVDHRDPEGTRTLNLRIDRRHLLL